LQQRRNRDTFILVPMTRRELLAHTPLVAAQLSGVFVLLSACKRSLQVTAPNVPALVMFKEDEARTLDAALALMIPSHVPPGAPGAREANVITFVDRELQKRHFESVARSIRRALIALSEASKRDLHHDFHALDGAGQEAMLTRLQMNTLAFGKKLDTGVAFAQLRTLAFEGFLGDPKYGGNANAVAWTWLDLPIAMLTHAHQGHQ